MTAKSGFNASGVVQIVVCLIAVVMGTVVTLSFGVYVPYFVEAFDAPVGAISIAASIALFMMGIASPVVGRMLDSRTVRSIFVTGALILVTGCLALSFSANVTHLYSCYLVMGITVAVLGPVAAIKHMTVWFPQNLGLATALVCLPLGAIFYPPLTNWLIELLGWRQSFQVYAATALLVAGLVLLIKAARGSQASSEDQASSSQETTTAALSSREVYAPLLRSSMFWFAILAFCCFMSAQLSAMTHLVVVAQSKGMTIDDGVLFLTVMGIASLVGGPLSGVIADKLGPRTGYILVGLLQSSALVLLLGKSSYSLLLVSSVVLGLFLSANYVFFVAFVTQVIGHKNFGTGFGLATLIWSVISAFSPTIAGLVYDRFGSYDWHFGVLAALTLLSGVGAWLAKPPSEIVYSGQLEKQPS